MADRKVKRNTSKQIISYTLDPQGTDSYGTVKFPASKTDYIRAGFNKVLYSAPIELINPTPTTELTIISEERLDLNEFTGFKDTFSARYELPPTKTNYYHFAQSWESKDKPYGWNVLEFGKVVFGPKQTTPNTYTITKELIQSGNDLKFTYYVNAFNRRTPTASHSLATTVRARLDRSRKGKGETPRAGFAERFETPEHWETGRKDSDKKPLPDLLSGRDFNIPLTATYTLKNEDMQEFDEWRIAGVAGADGNSHLGYKVDSSWWDIQLISN